jgi:hypothetical protein
MNECKCASRPTLAQIGRNIYSYANCLVHNNLNDIDLAIMMLIHYFMKRQIYLLKYLIVNGYYGGTLRTFQKLNCQLEICEGIIFLVIEANIFTYKPIAK